MEARTDDKSRQETPFVPNQSPRPGRSRGHPTRLRPLVALDLLRIDLVPRVQDDDPTRRDLASGCVDPGPRQPPRAVLRYRSDTVRSEL